MKLVELTQRNRKWDFVPQVQWPEVMPPVLWNDIVLTGFTQANPGVQALDLTAEGDWAELIAKLYPNLSLFELFRLNQIVRSSPHYSETAWDYLVESSGYRPGDDFENTLLAIAKLTEPARDFFAQKTFEIRDLAPLRVVRNWESLNVYLEAMVKFPVAPSKSEAAQALELLVEVIEMGRSTTALSAAASFGVLLAELKKARYPQATAQVAKLSDEVLRMGWPKNVVPRMFRSGDKTVLEVKLTVGDGEELRHKANEISALGAELEKRSVASTKERF